MAPGGGSRDQRRRDFTFRYPKPKTSERPLLQGQREGTPELLTFEETDKPAPKFASFADLSDSEEAEMSLSENSEDEDSRPRKRRAIASESKDSTPPPPPTALKWSNPDPYTALPPPDESQHKRMDVVKMIRKAKLQNSLDEAKKDAVTDNDDFISLGPAPVISTESQAPDNAPKGPKSMEQQPPSLPSSKRTRDDESKGVSFKTGKPRARFMDDGSILYQWKAFSGQDDTPWMSNTYPMHPSRKLHCEVLDFFNWVRPHDYEQIVREDLISRLDDAFRQRYGPVSVKPFGSFASGMYLPTADIDLVLLSKGFMAGGRKQFGERKGQIYAFSAYLKSLEIAVPGSIETIAHARVPILKFIDKLTGIRVDLSFDNDSGIIANRTFQEWKRQYPLMPVIVSVIKQFLLLRGLNEVPTGGLGGFSITCLVTSLLQHMPSNKQDNIGDVLMSFFDFYGFMMDYERVGLRMEPPGYYNKGFGDNDRLSIIDPNNSSNDISGGTKEIRLIFRAFRDAHDSLSRRMQEIAHSNQPKSILQAIIAANYDEYTEQRFQLRHVYENSQQFARYRGSPAGVDPDRNAQKTTTQRPVQNPADRPHLVPRGPRRK
ncbi:ribonuclease H-like protein [Penicillium atrosanguineum]|uniref:ribonuclease H-like protein n=1 Tax=Penicillium atrosanguineum TaxID=1132637 RepID=UPI0023859DF1|nr:ribonuclease H-like protein [Penicillium atrosanguineum]KAJ5313935.1 ribonuclease H-like protein [Penicillium atrosanguineum]